MTKRRKAPVFVDHDLPMLRVAQAFEAVPDEMREAVQVVVNIIGEGTRRVGHVCPKCWKPVTWFSGTIKSYAKCEEHGTMEYPALTIAFPPIGVPDE